MKINKVRINKIYYLKIYNKKIFNILKMKYQIKISIVKQFTLTQNKNQEMNKVMILIIRKIYKMINRK